MSRPFIVLGDQNDHGGVVIEASVMTDTHGKGIARVGDQVTCPKRNHGTTVIVTGEATNIQTGTRYLQLLIERETAKGVDDPIAEAYKDYRGLRNGVYYRKIKAGAAELAKQPDSMDVLRNMVK